MKTDTNAIYCYGDSNTWGYSPYGGSRFTENRWPLVLQRKSGCNLLENGVSGRTVVHYRGLHRAMSGENNFPGSLKKINSCNILIYFLGINDILMYESSTEAIAAMTAALLESAECKYKILMAPLSITDIDPANSEEKKMQNKVMKLKELYQSLAERNNYIFFDPDTVIRASTADGVHIEEKDHIKLGTALTELITNNNKE
jgi:lysophospholipase L1-like esterase